MKGFTNCERCGKLKNAATILTKEQIGHLDKIHFAWEDAYLQRWEYGYEQATKYWAFADAGDIPYRGKLVPWAEVGG